jgi:hypothetical protein
MGCNSNNFETDHENVNFAYFFSKEVYGEKLSHNKTASNTLRLYYSEEDLKSFFESSQAKFWEKNGHPFVKLSPEEIKDMLPPLDQQSLGNIDLIYSFMNS